MGVIMPMGIVSDDEFLSEIKNLSIKDITIKESNPIIAQVIDKPEQGRGLGNTEVPEVMRGIIGETALVENSKDVALAFGISPSSVSAYKNGATSTASYNLPDSDLKNRINKSRDRITSRARKKLNLALEHITPERMSDIKAKDAAGIAKDMSAIIKNLEPQNEKEDNRVQFIFYSPKQKTEDDYDVIQLSD